MAFTDEVYKKLEEQIEEIKDAIYAQTAEPPLSWVCLSCGAAHFDEEDSCVRCAWTRPKRVKS